MDNAIQITVENIKNLRVVQLREELEKRGLEKSGLKADLLTRLEKSILEEKEKEAACVSFINEDNNVRNENKDDDEIEIEKNHSDEDQVDGGDINELPEDDRVHYSVTSTDDLVDHQSSILVDADEESTSNVIIIPRDADEEMCEDVQNNIKEAEVKDRDVQDIEHEEIKEEQMETSTEVDQHDADDLSDSDDTKINLIVNYLPSTLSQSDVKQMFTCVGPVLNCKLVRNKATGQSLGYAFIKYLDEETAASAITQINGIEMQGKTIKVSYARQSSPEIKNANVYIAGLPISLSEDKLHSLFSSFGAVLSKKVLKNPDGTSRGAGFIRFAQNSEATNAIKAMAGKTLPDSDIPLTVKLANREDSIKSLNAISTHTIAGFGARASRSSQDNKNANVYIAGLPKSVSEDKLLSLFSPFGSVSSHKLLTDSDGTSRGVAFVRYCINSEATNAIKAMAGKSLPDSDVPLTVKLALPPASKNSSRAINAITTNILSGVGVATRATNVRFNPMAIPKQILLNQGMKLQATNSTAAVAAAFSGINTNVAQNSVYVYGLQSNHTKLTLYELFSPFGAIGNVTVVCDLKREEKPCKGYGFVNFSKNEDALRAVASMNSLLFENKILQVSLKQSRKEPQVLPQINVLPQLPRYNPGIATGIGHTMGVLRNMQLMYPSIKFPYTTR